MIVVQKQSSQKNGSRQLEFMVLIKIEIIVVNGNRNNSTPRGDGNWYGPHMTRKEVASFAAQIYCYCNVGITLKNMTFSKGFVLANFDLSRLGQISVLTFWGIFCTMMLNPGCLTRVTENELERSIPMCSSDPAFPFWHRHALRITEGKLIENIEGHTHIAILPLLVHLTVFSHHPCSSFQTNYSGIFVSIR